MKLISNFGGPPPQEGIPTNLSNEYMLLFAAWAHGMKRGDIAHRSALFAYVQSHIANKSEETLQGTINKSDYWFRGGENGTYILKDTGENAMISKFTPLPAQANLNANYIFTRKFKGHLFQIEVNPVNKELKLEVDTIEVKSIDAIAKLKSLGATFKTNSTSYPRRILNWIIQDNNYIWKCLSESTQATYAASNNTSFPIPIEIEPQIETSSQETGQGFRVSNETRKAIEDKAMLIASSYFKEEGWIVTNVSSNHSYDLHCKMRDQELYVEVKGTTTDGASVLLTPNEVTHAQQNYPNTALFVVSNLVVNKGQDNGVVIEGGEIKLFQPWSLESEYLTVTGYSYELPTKK